MRETFKERARARLEYLRKRKRVWKADLASFAADGLTIRPKDAAPRRFVFNSVQRALDAALDAQRAELGMVRALVLKARQMGVSTYVGARFYHRMRNHAGHRTLIMTHREDATDNLAGMVKRYHEHDPDPPPLAARGKSAMAFANDSAITVATAGAQVTGSGVSFTHQLGHLSELALWQAAAAHLTGILPTFPERARLGSHHRIDGSRCVGSVLPDGAGCAPRYWRLHLALLSVVRP